MHEDDYRGTAVLSAGEREIPVEVRLRGYFQPIDGKFHWYGRVAANDAVAEIAAGKRQRVQLRTSAGEATGDLSDPDPWGRYRITGTGRPPFEVPSMVED